MRWFTVLFAVALLSACTPSAGPAASPDPSTQAVIPSATIIPTQAASSTPVFTATPTLAPTSTAIPDNRWFWVVSPDNQVLAFNLAGQVNPILDLSGIPPEGNDSPPIRLTADRAFILFANSGDPKAFLLGSNSATAVPLPKVQLAAPGNGWLIHTGALPYIFLEAPYGATVPTIMINTETGQTRLLASNVFVGLDYSTYYIRLSEDGRSLRYATGEDPVEVHNLNLQTGKDTVFFETSSYVVTDDFGEIWYDVRQDSARTAAGQTVPMPDPDGNTRYLVFGSRWVLSSPRNCDMPCPLQVFQADDHSSVLNYDLPVDLVAYTIGLSSTRLLDHDRLLVSLYDNSAGSDSLPILWLLGPDGQGQQLGKGATSYGYSTNSLSSDAHYLMVYPADGTSAFLIYDLQTGKVLFSGPTAEKQAFLEVRYFPAGITVLDISDTTSTLWVHLFPSGSTFQINLTDEYEVCPAMATDGRLICNSSAGVVLLDPATAGPTLLIPGPVTSVSD